RAKRNVLVTWRRNRRGTWTNLTSLITAGRGMARRSLFTTGPSASTISALRSITSRSALRTGTMVSGSNEALSARQRKRTPSVRSGRPARRSSETASYATPPANARQDLGLSPSILGECSAQHERKRIESIEQQRLVLLEVLAVPRREALQGREQRHEVAQQPARFGTRQLEDVGVPLLRQQARAGAEVVRQAHEAELRAGIEHELGREAREVRAHEGQRKQDFRDEVAVARRVQGVGGD